MVNLLPQVEFDVSVVGRALKWAMGTFRIIVIVTEMVVMGAFLSRFWLDAKNSDLNDLITIKSSQILAQADFEKEFRNLQLKLDIVDKMDSETKVSGLLLKITELVPPDVNLVSVSSQEENGQIKGLTGSEISVAQFVSNLSADPFFDEVSLGQIGQPEDNPSMITFAINIKY